MTDRAPAIDAARALLVRAVAARIFPAAVTEVGHGGGVLWREAFGTLTFDPNAPAADAHTVFDLASLTKPIATASCAMELVNAGALSLDERLATYLREWSGADREPATVRDLLEHSSGLPARLVDRAPESRAEFVHDICLTPLEYRVRSKSIYSDLGFILLGFVVDDRTRTTGQTSFAERFAEIFFRLKPNRTSSEADVLGFAVPAELQKRTAPTWPLDDDRRRGRLLVAEVHDDYAAALNGVAGHSGLFGNASGVGKFARAMLNAARGNTPGVFSPADLARLTAVGSPGTELEFAL